MNRRPTRRDLLQVIGRLQTIIGGAKGASHDRNPNARAQVETALTLAQNLCLEATAQDPSEASEPTGKGWGDDSGDNAWRTAR